MIIRATLLTKQLFIVKAVSVVSHARSKPEVRRCRSIGSPSTLALINNPINLNYHRDVRLQVNKSILTALIQIERGWFLILTRNAEGSTAAGDA